MANPIAFKPKSVDPKLELERRLAAAPREHAEALLVAYDVLEAAHREGILDAVHGAIGAKDTLVGLIAKYSAEPVSVNAIRNLLAIGKLVGSLDPEPISELSKHIAEVMAKHKANDKPVSLWTLFRQTLAPESRRGLALATALLGAVGRSFKA